MRYFGMPRLLSAVLFVSLAGAGAMAQTAIGGQVTAFKDTSMLKPPAGSKVAIVEWEDLECPACARAFPIVHQAAAQYKIPLVRHDFLIPGHIWSRDGAIYARYIQDKISPDLATDYRRQVFASQFRIASKDDLKAFTASFLKSHGQQMPFALDPAFEREVVADRDLGDKLGLNETPTIIVVTPKNWIQVRDVMDLYKAIDQANAEAARMAPEPAKKPVATHTTAHK
ncbi:MAG TPA: thioredoxin domain-containing protein [Acidobacteriaceae bacterium]